MQNNFIITYTLFLFFKVNFAFNDSSQRACITWFDKIDKVIVLLSAELEFLEENKKQLDTVFDGFVKYTDLLDKEDMFEYVFKGNSTLFKAKTKYEKNINDQTKAFDNTLECIYYTCYRYSKLLKNEYEQNIQKYNFLFSEKKLLQLLKTENKFYYESYLENELTLHKSFLNISVNEIVKSIKHILEDIRNLATMNIYLSVQIYFYLKEDNESIRDFRKILIQRIADIPALQNYDNEYFKCKNKSKGIFKKLINIKKIIKQVFSIGTDQIEINQNDEEQKIVYLCIKGTNDLSSINEKYQTLVSNRKKLDILFSNCPWLNISDLKSVSKEEIKNINKQIIDIVKNFDN